MITKDYKNMVAPNEVPKEKKPIVIRYMMMGFLAGCVVSSFFWMIFIPAKNTSEKIEVEAFTHQFTEKNTNQDVALKSDKKAIIVTVPVVKNSDEIVTKRLKPTVDEKSLREEKKFDFYTELNKPQEVVVEKEPVKVIVGDTSLVEAKVLVKEKKLKVAAKQVKTLVKPVKPKIRVKPSQRQPVVESSGLYLLQVASYNRRSDAESMRHQLLRHGIQTHLQIAPINGKGVFYRLKTDAFSIEYINNLRKKLQSNGISPKVVRVK